MMLTRELINGIITIMVGELEFRHPNGGRSYFDELDSYLASPIFYEALIPEIDLKSEMVVSTGRFGYGLYLWLASRGFRFDGEFVDMAVLNGGIRHLDVQVVNPYCTFGAVPTWKKAVFVDDSIYSGTTRDRASSFVLSQFGMPISRSVVIYDGSAEMETDAFYRYFEGRPHKKDTK